MKFLVDANLPPRLCHWLRARGHEAEHLTEMNLLTVTDTQLWDRGKNQQVIIFSKDVDFYDRAALFGAPPQVLHVAVGNCSNARLFHILNSEWADIEAALSSGSKLISVTQQRIEVFP